jgi:hypothetical protein
LKRRLLLSLVSLLQTLLVYNVVAQRFPLSGDDYSYLYQANLFAHGQIAAQDPLYDPRQPLYSCLTTNCLRDDNGHRFSKYPPGWPILLAAGVTVGAEWAVGPLLGALLVFLLLTHVELRMGREWVMVTWLVLTFCVFLSYYAASLRAHTATALFVFAAFLFYDATLRNMHRAGLWLFAAGALLGYSSMMRYVDWVPLGAWMVADLLRRRRFADLLMVGCGFCLLASGNLLYNALLLGDPFRIAAYLSSASAVQDRLMISWTGFVVTAERLGTVLWVFPPVLLVAGFWKRRREFPDVERYLALFSMCVGLYFFYPAAIGGPGPRYFFAYFPFLILAVVELYRWIRRENTRRTRRLWTLALAAQIVCSVTFAAREAYTVFWRSDLTRTVQQATAGRRIVLLASGTYRTDVRDLTRNPPVLASADTLYFVWRDRRSADALVRLFPGRSVSIYEYPGRLTPYDAFAGSVSGTARERSASAIPAGR